MERRTWRDILLAECNTPTKKRELAERLGTVSPRAIERWMAGQHDPQKDETVLKLASVINTDEMRDALKRDFPEAFGLPRHIPLDEGRVPGEFYRRLVHGYSYVPGSSRRWSLFRLVAQQLLPHLDPDRTGLVVLYAQASADVVSILESAGNMHWTNKQVSTRSEHDPRLARLIEDSSPIIVQSRAESDFATPLCLLARDCVSAWGAIPIYRAGNSIGALLVYSCEEEFFTPLRQALLEEYCSLFALALT